MLLGFLLDLPLPLACSPLFPLPVGASPEAQVSLRHWGREQERAYRAQVVEVDPGLGAVWAGMCAWVCCPWECVVMGAQVVPWMWGS